VCRHWAPRYGIAVAARDGDSNIGKLPRDHLLHKDELSDCIAPYTEHGAARRKTSRGFRAAAISAARCSQPVDAEIQRDYLEIEEHGRRQWPARSRKHVRLGLRLKRSAAFIAHSQN